VLTGSLAKRLEELLLQACEVNRWELHELSVMADHVHLLLQISPKDSLSEVVQRLKGGSSRVLKSEFPELEEFLWGESFWAEGFFAETVGQQQECQQQEWVIRRYIREQGQPQSQSESEPG